MGGYSQKCKCGRWFTNRGAFGDHHKVCKHVTQSEKLKLTKPQKALLSRELILDYGEPFITLCDVNEDRVAKALSSKGLGYFVNNGMHYTWRNRSGYTNNFYPNEKGLEVIKELRA